jgi:peptidoglycan hydrolase CwlO-like protein
MQLKMLKIFIKKNGYFIDDLEAQVKIFTKYRNECKEKVEKYQTEVDKYKEIIKGLKERINRRSRE